MLSRLVITFLPKRKRFCFVLFCFFNFMAAVTICSDFGAPTNKVYTVSTVSPYIYHEVMVPDAMIIVF